MPSTRQLLEDSLGRVFHLDLGQTYSVEEGTLPRYSVWSITDGEAVLLHARPGRLDEKLTKTDKEEVARIVRREIKDHAKDDKKSVELVRNVLVQLFKTLYVKRSAWANDLSNRYS